MDKDIIRDLSRKRYYKHHDDIVFGLFWLNTLGSIVFFYIHHYVNYGMVIVSVLLLLGEHLAYRGCRKRIIKSYNNFYEYIQQKPYLPKNKRDIEEFFVWTQQDSRVFDASVIDEDLYLEIAETYDQKPFWVEYQSDENSTPPRKHFYPIARHDYLSGHSQHQDMELALCYQIFTIYKKYN